MKDGDGREIITGDEFLSTLDEALIHEGEDENEQEPDYDEYEAECVECGKTFVQERDIQLCDDCVDKFDLDKLWKLHDQNKLDALDFNENATMRERFRIKK